MNSKSDTHSLTDTNYKVVRMVLHGFTTHAIARATGFTHNQVQGRVAAYGLQGRRADYRNGHSAEGAEMLQKVCKFSKATLAKEADYYEIVRTNVRERTRQLRWQRQQDKK